MLSFKNWLLLLLFPCPIRLMRQQERINNHRSISSSLLSKVPFYYPAPSLNSHIAADYDDDALVDDGQVNNSLLLGWLVEVVGRNQVIPWVENYDVPPHPPPCRVCMWLPRVMETKWGPRLMFWTSTWINAKPRVSEWEIFHFPLPCWRFCYLLNSAHEFPFRSIHRVSLGFKSNSVAREGERERVVMMKGG